jgi:hypothetical protein
VKGFCSSFVGESECAKSGLPTTTRARQRGRLTLELWKLVVDKPLITQPQTVLLELEVVKSRDIVPLELLDRPVVEWIGDLGRWSSRPCQMRDRSRKRACSPTGRARR